MLVKQRTLFEAGAIIVALGIVGILVNLVRSSHNFALSSGQPVLGDFIAFWSAGRAALEGHAATVHERATTWIYHKQAIPDIRFHAPWNSPPTFLLVVAPFALLPYPAAALLFLALTGALYVYAAIKLLPDRRSLLFALAAPAAVYHLGTVQVGLLIAGVLALALHWLDRKPLRAGALVGFLAIKPHLAILWPLMLALTGRWRAFFAAAAAAAAFCLLAGFVFGFDTFVNFFKSLQRSTQIIAEQRVTTPSYASLFGNLLQLHVGRSAAALAHAASAIAAIAAASWVFRRDDVPAQGAALCAATMLVSPYLFFYDAIVLAVGAAVMGAPRGRFETLAYVFAWGAALTLPIGHFLTPLPICPVASWLLLIAAIRRVAAYPTKRSQAPPRSAQSLSPEAA